MKVKKLDHVGIAVKDLEKAIKFYEDVLGIDLASTEVVEDQHVKVAFLPLGETEIELLESTTEDGPIARYIEKNGPGIQHLAFGVDNIDEAIKEMEAKGLRMIDKVARYGAGGARIAFMHPKESYSVLVELTER